MFQRNHIRLFLTGFLLLIAPLSLTANEPNDSTGVVLEADLIEVDNKASLLEANGNVQILYEGMNFKTDSLKFDYKNQDLYVPKTLKVDYPKLQVQVKNLHHNFKTSSGTTDAFKGAFEKVSIKGKESHYVSKKMELYDATFSTCGTDDHHYDIKAKKLSYFPKSKTLVANKGIVKVVDIPLLPIPTFVWRNGGQSDRSKFSSVGQNRIEHLNAATNIDYFITETIQGDLRVGYSAKQGYKIGLWQTNTILNQKVKLISDFFYHEKLGFQGGITAKETLYLSSSTTQNKGLFPGLNLEETNENHGLGIKWQVDWQYNLAKREYLLDLLPQLTLETVYNQSAPHFAQFSIKTGYTEEKTQVHHHNFDILNQGWNTTAIAQGQVQLYEKNPFTLGIKGHAFNSFYDKKEPWYRGFTEIWQTWDFKKTNLYLGYWIPLYNDGSGFFEYEKRYGLTENELSFEFKTAYGPFPIRVNGNYTFAKTYGDDDDNEFLNHFRELSVGVEWRTDCVKIMTDWDFREETLKMGVQIY